MFDNFLVRKQVVLDHKILILNSGHIGFSQRGRPMILVKKWKFYLCMFLDKWTLKYCLMIIEVENKPSQTIKIWILQSCHTEIFTQGLTKDFGEKLQKNWFFFWQNKSRNNVWWSSGEKSNPQPIKCASNFMINKLFFLATNHSVCINFCPQSVSQSAMQVVSQSASQSGSQSISQSVSQSASQLVSKSMILVKNCKFPFCLF